MSSSARPQANGLKNGVIVSDPQPADSHFHDPGAGTTDGVPTALAKKKAPPIHHITENFVPLSEIVGRLLQYSYSEIINLLETLTSQSDVRKKRAILEYCLSLRQQFIRLLVLTQWSKDAEQISRCIDVVAFLDGQKNCFHNTVSALRHVREAMLHATVRNPDIRTAVDVLSTGTFPRLLNVCFVRDLMLTLAYLYQAITSRPFQNPRHHPNSQHNTFP